MVSYYCLLLWSGDYVISFGTFRFHQIVICSYINRYRTFCAINCDTFSLFFPPSTCLLCIAPLSTSLSTRGLTNVKTWTGLPQTFKTKSFWSRQTLQLLVMSCACHLQRKQFSYAHLKNRCRSNENTTSIHMK